MIISIIGTRAAGKSSVERYLASTHGFRPVRIKGTGANSLNTYHARSNLSGVATSSSLLEHGTNDAISTDLPYNGDLPGPLIFDTAADLLDHVTRNWRDSFVSCDLDTPQLIEMFIKRPFFLLVAIDAPLIKRYSRMLSSAPNLTLEEFVEENDALLYSKHQYTSHETTNTSCSSLHDMFRLSNVHIVNAFASISDLHVYLNKINLPDPDRLRPQWDTYFMTLAGLASHRSNCMKRRVGAILVRDKRIVSTGYNGTPRNVRNCNEGGCRRCNSGVPSGAALDECLCLHAEENALLEAGRERVGERAVLYCNTCPCLGCAIKIVQTGVKEVVYNLSYKVDDRTASLFKEAGVVLRQHSPPQ